MAFENIISRWKKANPDLSHQLGLHEYDGILPDLSKEGVKNRIIEIKSDIEMLKKMKPESRLQKFEVKLLKQSLENELFVLDVEKPFLYSPLYWIGFGRSWVGTIGAIEMSYTQKEYAPIEDRVRAIIQLERGIPNYLSLSKERLTEKKEPLPRPITEMAINFAKGHINYLKDKLISFVTKVDPEELLDQWSQANVAAVKALEDYLEFLEDQLKQGTDEFALGETMFLQKLTKSEGVETDVETLLNVGDKELQRNLSILQDVADKRANGDVDALMETVLSIHPKAEDLLDFVVEANDKAKKFIEESNLVTIPLDKQCEVIETPQGMRNFGFAAMNTPGPFEPPEASQAYYWVTPVEHHWDDKRAEDHLRFFNDAMTHNVTVHEAWPGHYLQLLWNQKSKSEIAKIFARSYGMIEGWAHYTEEMIYNHGYEPMDRDYYHVGQLFGAIIRLVRYLSAINLHCREMKVEESQQLFIKYARMPPASAMIEANRGRIDPMYMNYTLGKLLIKKLRNDYEEEKGDDFDLKIFHDTLLSYGSSPIAVLRDMILENNNGVFL